MARVLYPGITSLDGYVADRDGSFSWSVPDEEVHRFVNDAERSVGTYLLGRRLYEVMVAWETMGGADAHEVEADFARIWRGADKVVYSRTLDRVASERTRIERTFDADEVRRLKDTADGDLLVGGPGLAASALRAGLVDEVSQLVSPVVVGGGTPFWPDGLRLDLALLEERRFGNGVVHLRYRVR